MIQYLEYLHSLPFAIGITIYIVSIALVAAAAIGIVIFLLTKHRILYSVLLASAVWIVYCIGYVVMELMV